MPIFGDGSQTRAFSHIDDVARAFVLAATLPGASGKVVNVGSERPMSVAELARLVSKAMNVTHQVKELEKREEVLHAVAHHALQREIFGTGDSVELSEGLRDMAKWVKSEAQRRQAEDRPGFAWGNVEVERNMPPSWVEHATGHRPKATPKTET